MRGVTFLLTFYVVISCYWRTTAVVCQLHEVEAELENEARKVRDVTTENRKLQRQLVDQKNQSDADRRQVSELAEQCQSQQLRVKTLKRQLEEAVCISTR